MCAGHPRSQRRQGTGAAPSPRPQTGVLLGPDLWPTQHSLNQKKKKKAASFAYWCCAELTGDPADGPSHVRPSVSGYVGAQTVAYKVHVLQAELLLVLLEKEVATLTSAAATTDTKPTFNKSWASASCQRPRWYLTGHLFHPAQFGCCLGSFKTTCETLLAPVG